MKVTFYRLLKLGLVLCLSAIPVYARDALDIEASAEHISESSGFTGGFCVIIGDETGDLSTALSQRGRYVVQVLVPEESLLKKIRATLRTKGNYGLVSAIQSEYDFLPYAENLINIVVVKDYEDSVKRGLSIDEFFRVLRPLGSVHLDVS